MSLPLVKIYTDGSCSPNPGPGGWGVVVLPAKGKKKELSGNVQETTNNRMELQAALEALKFLHSPCVVQLYTDSRYLQNGITSWIDTWRKKNWRTSEGKPVSNRDLWEMLDCAMQKHEVQWIWVKGHADNSYNELADTLAVTARGRKILPLGDDTAVHIFLGITCKQKLKIGSWAAIFRYQNHYKVAGELVKNSSANRIHILSACHALQSLKRRMPVHIYTSSGYLRDGACNWLKGWKNNGWQTREGKIVSNKEAWKLLSELLQSQTVTFHVIDKAAPPCHSQEAKELACEVVDDHL